MQYDFTLNAGGGGNIDATGEYVKYKSGLGAIRVRFSTGGYVDLTPGQGIRVQKRFNSINLTDRSGNANQGVLVVGDVDFQDDSITGVVSIVDGGKNSTLSKNCFLGNTISPAVAANYSLVALINPAGNTKNLVVESVTGSLSGATTLAMYMLSMSPALNFHGQNKYAGLAGGQPSTAYIEGNQTPTLALGVTAFQQQAVAAGLPMTRKFAEPLIIPPGMAVIVANTTLNQGVNVDFEWREDPV